MFYLYKSFIPASKHSITYLINTYYSPRRWVDVKDDPLVTMGRAWGSGQWRGLSEAISSEWEQETTKF